MKNTKTKNKSPKASTKTQPKVSGLEKKPDGTITFKLTIAKQKVAIAYKKAVTIAVSESEIKGFRKGKAPESRVIELIGKQKLYTEALKLLLPSAYSDIVKKLKLAPITSPRIEPESLEESKDWELKVTLAEKPEITLGDYKKAVSAALASSKIWIPGKDTTPPTSGTKTTNKEDKTQDSTEEKLSKVFEALLSSATLKLPKFLLEEEINRQLARLVQQIEKLNLTIEQYVSSLGKNIEQLKSEYNQQAERTLKLEFILNEIAQEQKVTVEDAEVQAVINAVGDEKLRKSLDNPSERTAIHANLRKRKVIESLLRL